MSGLRSSGSAGSFGGLIVAIAGAAISIVLWIAKFDPRSDVIDPLNLPPDATTGWSGLAIVAAICGGLALLFAVVRGLVSRHGVTGITVLFAVIALSYPAAIVLGDVAPERSGPFR